MKRQSGLSLVEILIALSLGLVVLGAVVTMFFAQREAFRSNEALAQMQENARFALEMIARELREAGGNFCDRSLPTAVVLNQSDQLWWAQWQQSPIHGYDSNDNSFPHRFGTSPGNRRVGTDAVTILSATANTTPVRIVEHNPLSAQFMVNTPSHGVRNGDIVLACDSRQAALFQVTNANSNNVTIVHNTGTGHQPGNCTKGLGLPVRCTAVGTPYPFSQGGYLAQLNASAWYVGRNERDGWSLWRLRLLTQNENAETRAEEIAEGITGLQLRYLEQGRENLGFLTARDVREWNKVTAVRVTVTTESQQPVGVRLSTTGTERTPLERQWTIVVSLRNQLP